MKKKDWKYYIPRTIERLKKLPNEKFNYEIFQDNDPECGTAACIAGWMVNWFPSIKKEMPFIGSNSNLVYFDIGSLVYSLDLTYAEGQALFLGHPLFGNSINPVVAQVGHLTRNKAIKRLEKFYKWKLNEEKRMSKHHE